MNSDQEGKRGNNQKCHRKVNMLLLCSGSCSTGDATEGLQNSTSDSLRLSIISIVWDDKHLG